jgi:D-sedoheptulose 7-phosphate isomerase
MPLQDRIHSRIEGSAQLALDAAAALAPGIAAAAQLIVHCLTQGGKVLAVGAGNGIFLARHFASLMVNRYEADRPGLAAIALACDLALAGDGDGDGRYTRQIRSLGLPGDVLLALDAGDDPGAILALGDAAAGRGMARVVLGPAPSRAAGEPAADDAVHLMMPAASGARLHELQLLALHCLCDAVDSLLLGVD